MPSHATTLYDTCQGGNTYGVGTKGFTFDAVIMFVRTCELKKLLFYLVRMYVATKSYLPLILLRSTNTACLLYESARNLRKAGMRQLDVWQGWRQAPLFQNLNWDPLAWKLSGGTNSYKSFPIGQCSWLGIIHFKIGMILDFVLINDSRLPAISKCKKVKECGQAVKHVTIFFAINLLLFELKPSDVMRIYG